MGTSNPKNGKSGKQPARKPLHNKPQNALVPVTVKTHHDKKGGHPHVIMGNIDDKHTEKSLICVGRER